MCSRRSHLLVLGAGKTSPPLLSVLLFCPFLCLYLLAHLSTSAPFSQGLALPLWSPPLPKPLSHTPQLPSSEYMSQLAGATAQAPGAAPQVSPSRSAPPAGAGDRLHSGQELPVSLLLPLKSGHMCSAPDLHSALPKLLSGWFGHVWDMDRGAVWSAIRTRAEGGRRGRWPALGPGPRLQGVSAPSPAHWSPLTATEKWNVPSPAPGWEPHVAAGLDRSWNVSGVLDKHSRLSFLGRNSDPGYPQSS